MGSARLFGFAERRVQYRGARMRLAWCKVLCASPPSIPTNRCVLAHTMQTYLTTNGTGQCIQAETLVNLYCYNFYHPQESPKARQDLPATSAPGPSQICTTPGGPLTAPAELSREMTLRQR